MIIVALCALFRNSFRQDSDVNDFIFLETRVNTLQLRLYLASSKRDSVIPSKQGNGILWLDNYNGGVWQMFFCHKPSWLLCNTLGVT